MRYVNNEKESVKITLKNSFRNSVNDLYYGMSLMKKISSDFLSIVDGYYDDVLGLLVSATDSLEYAYRSLGACLELVDQLDTSEEVEDEDGEEHAY